MNIPSTKVWGNKGKQKARRDTIIQKIGHLQPGQQYWTLCGNCTLEDGSFNPDSELGQLLREGVLTKEQFYGVDNNPAIIQHNRKACPEANWFVGDFYEVLGDNCARPDFNPAVVNADLTNIPDTGVPYMAKIVSLLSPVRSSIFLVVNMVLCYERLPGRDCDAQFVMDRFNACPLFNIAFQEARWEWEDKYYWYHGGSFSGTTMGTFTLRKPIGKNT